MVALGGNRVAYGINGLVDGRLDDANVKQRALDKAKESAFWAEGTGSETDTAAIQGSLWSDGGRSHPAADTDLLVEITRDLTVPGEEAKFGGGKVIRDGMDNHP